MKNLNEMGVMELRGNEMQEVDGGGFWKTLGAIAAGFFLGFALSYA